MLFGFVTEHRCVFPVLLWFSIKKDSTNNISLSLNCKRRMDKGLLPHFLFVLNFVLILYANFVKKSTPK